MLRSVVGSIALLTTLSSPLAAQYIVGTATGLIGPYVTMDFNAIALANNVAITDQAGNGVTFGNATYGQVPQFGGAVFTTSAVYNFDTFQNQAPTLVMHFGMPISAAAFNVMTIRGPTLFEAFDGVVKVGSFEAVTGLPPANALGPGPYSHDLFWGFQGDVKFNRIVITSNAPDGSKAIGIDNLQLASHVVPEPSTVALFAFGIAGIGVAHARRRRKGQCIE